VDVCYAAGTYTQNGLPDGAWHNITNSNHTGVWSSSPSPLHRTQLAKLAREELVSNHTRKWKGLSGLHSPRILLLTVCARWST
jgi:hypothetical protein